VSIKEIEFGMVWKEDQEVAYGGIFVGKNAFG
jgi:hypothetical protein